MSEKTDTLLRALQGGKQVIKEWSGVAQGADKSIIEMVTSDLNEAISIAEKYDAEIAQAVTAETATIRKLRLALRLLLESDSGAPQARAQDVAYDVLNITKALEATDA